MKKLVCRYVCSVLMVLSLFGLTASLNGIVYTVGKEIVERLDGKIKVSYAGDVILFDIIL